jgi:hypothetical protein
MKLPETRIGRLKLTADGLAKESYIPRGRLVTTLLAVVTTLLAIGSEADRTETLLVWIIAVMLIITSASFWLRWKYSLHVLSLAFALVGIVYFTRLGHRPSILGWSAAIAMGLTFGNSAYCFWKIGSAISAMKALGIHQEFADVRMWLDWLVSQRSPREVLEISAGNFWTGYFTYRLVKLDEFWAVAKFKKDNLERLYEYKFYQVDEVQVIDSPTGEKTLKIAGKLVPRVAASAKVWDALHLPASGN